MFEGCLCLFYELFHHLESENLLDPDSEVHLWCLHYIYLPIINRNLTNWRNAWSHHPLRTEKNLSPMQMWIQGIHLTNGSTLDVVEVYIIICNQISVHMTVMKTMLIYIFSCSDFNCVIKKNSVNAKLTYWEVLFNFVPATMYRANK